MKGGLVVMLELARTVPEPAVDVTYVFYAREEIASAESGLGRAVRRASRPAGRRCRHPRASPPTPPIEAGCQGTLRLRVTLRGARAHTARPWMGRNAVHRLAGVLTVLDGYDERRPVIDGCEFREALQAVSVEAGVAGNVVPDEAVVTINHRFAPDRTAGRGRGPRPRPARPAPGGRRHRRARRRRAGRRPRASTTRSSPAWPRSASGTVSAKLGWTDVARFAEHGIPAVNFGPGDSTVAHTAGEFLDRAPLERVWLVLGRLLRDGPASA